MSGGLKSLFTKISSSNATFISFFALSAFGLQYFVVKSVDALWYTHNHKRSWAYLEKNIEEWKNRADEEEDDE